MIIKNEFKNRSLLYNIKMESFNLDNSQDVPYDLKNLDDTHPKESNVEGLKIQLMNQFKYLLNPQQYL